ncbi:MAG TPA: UDP-N-acetylmuramoyl-L-alanine--D-glutamate ligase [Xanthobacteraceae bacterium]|nr:UDP-N-acetylmuramoyl-L-alanine--D-glutamate ligase [Xanthobacteraceae bacterium]
MTPITIFRDKKVAVFGLGKSGLATCAALTAGGAKVVAWDDKPAKVAEAQDKGVPTGDLKEANWQEIAALILAPGVPLTHPAPHWTVTLARRNEKEVIGDIELFCRERRARSPRSPFAAITGTNGKSTTTALLAHVLAKSGKDVVVGGNLGTAILSLAPPSQSRTHVIECSSFQIDLAPTLDPLVGVLLNISPDHIDRHGNLRNYAAIKERLISGVSLNGTAVVGVDDELSASVAERAEREGTKVVRVSVRRRLEKDGIYLDGDNLVDMERGQRRNSLSLAGIGSLRGRHNAQNAACAYASARALGLSAEEIAFAMRSFPGLHHRMEQVGRKGSVLFINDSKATNADSTERALESFDNIFWIAGGRSKEGGIKNLAPHFSRVRKAYLIGEAAQDFADTISGKIPFEVVKTLDRAVEAAARDAEAAQLIQAYVVLSPACASYDQYPNFEVRGDEFRDLVLRLPGVGKP